MIATEDVGKLAAQVLQEDWTANRYLELEGPRRYSPLDIAKILSDLLNRPVATKPVPHERWAAFFEEQGTAPDRTGPRIEMLDGFNSGWIDFEGEGAEHVRGTRSFEEVFCQLIRRAD
jgi:NAD(P)H dehydrogenase (quinone)